MKKAGRIYYTRIDKNIFSMAIITAEKHRRKGYARAIVQEICKSMIDNGKSVVLFFDNPDAGKMYKEIGFQDINRQATGYL